jgi:hypothetical protein
MCLPDAVSVQLARNHYWLLLGLVSEGTLMPAMNVCSGRLRTAWSSVMHEFYVL